jgi:hypothetical protein
MQRDKIKLVAFPLKFCSFLYRKSYFTTIPRLAVIFFHGEAIKS